MRLRVPSPPLGWAHSVLVAAVVGVPVALRLWLLQEKQLELAASDLQGLSADLAVGALIAIALLQLVRRSRVAGAVLAMAWIVLTFANYEHVRAFDAVGSLSYVGYVVDPVFLGGSVAHASHPLLLGLTVVSLLVSAKWWRGAARNRGWLAGGAGALVALAAVQPVDERHLPWRQNHFLLLNLRGAFEDTSIPPPVEVTSEDLSVAIGPLRADLSGKPRFEFGGRKPNVLIVLVESLSGAYLPSLAEYQGVRSSVRAPRLDAFAKKGIAWSSFIAHQRQTNRGEYAVLCGDLPKLTTSLARMSEIAQGSTRTCLPQMLRDAGYRSTYLQAAPLAFMMKDQFMKRVGFERAIGTEHFTSSYARNQWGIDDRAFFEQSLGVVRELRAAEGPWFLTMLTVGTHHPYLVPEDFKGRGNAFARAVDYADQALDAFLRALEREGVFEDTLVVVTSDESAGVSEGDDLGRTLTQNWIPLVVFTPEKALRGERVKDVYAHSDLALSILDYLGLPDSSGELMGRSIFRGYETARPVYFSNTYTRHAWQLEPDGVLSRCSERLRDCLRFGVDRLRPFSPIRRTLAVDSTSVGRWQQVLTWNGRSLDSAGAKHDAVRTFPLSLAESLEIAEEDEQQIVFGGQYLTVPKGSRLEVELEAEVSGDGAVVELTHDLIGPGVQAHRPQLPLLGDGDRLRTRWEYVFDQERNHVEVRLGARRVAGKNVQLRFAKAQLRLVPKGAIGRKAGARQHELRIERSGKISSLRFKGVGAARFRTSRCLRENKRDHRLEGRRCGTVHLLFGPYAWLPAGATLRARFEVAMVKGEAQVAADIVSSSGRTKHATSERLRLRAGERRVIELTFTARELVDGIEARLEHRPVGPQADIDVVSAELEIVGEKRSP